MINWDDFDKIWASTSPLTPYSFSGPNYAQGWNFVGNTPPARQMWDSIQKQNDEKFKYLRDNFGTPNIVTQASQMTDTDKVYVYLGSEAGWNNGHWYYYDEGTSSWADGGVYNSVAFVTDTTLSIAGQPADAKATGDALALKSNLAGCTFTGNVSVNADLSVTGASTLADTTVDDLVVNNDLSVAGDSSLTNLSVSGTTALAGTSTAPTPSADDNSTKIATTEYVQTEIKPIEADVTINDKRISNIEKLLQGNLYDYDTDTDSKYTKTVPQGAMPYASLDSIGGKTLVWNQICESSIYRTDGGKASGITITHTDTGFTLTGTTTSTSNTWEIRTYLPASHKFLLKGTPVQDGIALRIYIDGAYLDTTENAIFTSSADSSDLFFVAIKPSATDIVVNLTWTPQLFDLTLMFGAGNEPTTYAEFQQMFPAVWYAYNPGSLLSAGVTEVVSKKADTTTIAIYPIPAEIQALEGYGWSAGSVFNYIDYERKVFVKNVGSRAYASGDESDSTVVTDKTTTYYPLNPAIETDISAYLTDDNLIEVEAGGTLTFPNSNGTDYQITVPSAETYMVDLQSALGD